MSNKWMQSLSHMSEPWCWYIYLTKLGDVFGQMLGFIFQHHGSHLGYWICFRGYPLVNVYISLHACVRSKIFMAISNSYVSHYQGLSLELIPHMMDFRVNQHLQSSITSVDLNISQLLLVVHVGSIWFNRFQESLENLRQTSCQLTEPFGKRGTEAKYTL